MNVDKHPKTMKKSDKPIIIEEIYDQTIETVWRALTEPNQMRKWFFSNIPDFEPKKGFKVEFNIVDGEKNFPHQWR
jgi:uncharacterized protein YndB with AHSA1/START domain